MADFLRVTDVTSPITLIDQVVSVIACLRQLASEALSAREGASTIAIEHSSMDK